VLWVEVKILEDAPVGTHETDFDRVGVHKVELTVHDDAAAGFFVLLDCKMAIFKAKHVGKLLHQPKRQRIMAFNENLHREHFVPVSEFLFGLIIAVHKNVATDGMTVKITVKVQVSAIESLAHHTFDRCVDRVVPLRGSCPLSIQVGAHQRAPIIANDNTVRILHRDYFKHKSFTKVLGHLIVPYQEVDDSLHHPRGLCLSWVDPRRQYDCWPEGDIELRTREISHDHHIDVIPSV